MQVPASTHTQTHSHNQLERRGGSLKNTGGTSSSVFPETSSQTQQQTSWQTRARHTNKHTCCVLRHVDKWRFLIVMHCVLIWQKPVCEEQTRKRCTEQTLNKRYLQINTIVLLHFEYLKQQGTCQWVTISFKFAWSLFGRNEATSCSKKNH